MKRTRKFRPESFPLESRAVPGGVAGAAQVVAIRGSGQFGGGSESDVPGGVQARDALSGEFSGLGSTSGTLDTVIQTRSLRFNASAVLNAADGDQLDISFSGSNQTPHAGETRAVGRFAFRVNGGTGAFARSTGGGTITVTESLATGVDTFKIVGKVRESTPRS